jgi:uncharacterized membrane protein
VTSRVRGTERYGERMTSSVLHSLGLSALTGLVTGGRSTAGVSALVWSAQTQPDSALDQAFSHPRAKTLTGAAALGELVADKLPFTPSRLGFPQVLGRLGAGALCGFVIARRHGTASAPVVVVGVASAYAGSWLGARWRKVAAERFDNDLAGALMEDAAVVAGTAAVRSLCRLRR